MQMTYLAHPYSETCSWYVRDLRMVAAGYVVAFILLTVNISSLYDGIDADAFQVKFVFFMTPNAFMIV